jgi:hypothetical protein
MQSFIRSLQVMSSVCAALVFSACDGNDSGTGAGGAAGTGGDGGAGAQAGGNAGGSDGMGGDGASGGGTPDGGGGQGEGGHAEVELSNVPNEADCPAAMQYGIAPILPGEAGHYATTRLVPPSYPFEVTRIGYWLATPAGVAQCADQSLPHQVQIYVSDGAEPSNTPSTDGTLVDTLDVAGGAEAAHAVEVPLTSPITLQEGESIFIAVQMVGSGAQSICIGACGATAAIGGVDFWSNAANEPFTYLDMIDDFGFTYNFSTRAFGTPL